MDLLIVDIMSFMEYLGAVNIEKCINEGDIVITGEIGGYDDDMEEIIASGITYSDISIDSVPINPIVKECINKGDISINCEVVNGMSQYSNIILTGIACSSDIVTNCINYGNISANIE